MGRDKAALQIGPGPETLGQRTGALLAAAVAPSPALEVGPGFSSLEAVVEAEPGGGPLLAALAGRDALEALGYLGHVLVLATDLPLLSLDLLCWIASRPVTVSVAPVLGGVTQPLCARWSPAAFRRARTSAAAGDRSLRHVFEPGTLEPDESAWAGIAGLAGASSLVDVDDPVAVERLRGMAVEQVSDTDTIGLRSQRP